MKRNTYIYVDTVEVLREAALRLLELQKEVLAASLVALADSLACPSCGGSPHKCQND